MRALSFYIRSFTNELKKIKNSYLVLMTFAIAIFIPAIYFLHYLIDFDRVIPPDGVNPWGKYFFSQLAMTPTLFSFFVVVVTSYFVQMEHKLSAIKMIFAMPIPKWAIYFSKMNVILLVILIAYVLLFGLIVMSGYALSIINPQYAFAKFQPDYLNMFKVLISSYITVFGVVALQYWMSFKFKNFLLPLGFGIIMVIVGLMVFRSARFAPYFAYAYNISNLASINPTVTGNFQWLSKFSLFSLIYFVLHSVLGYLVITKSSLK